MYPSEPLASSMFIVVSKGLCALSFSPVMANTSLGMAVRPSSPILIAWSLSVRWGSSCRKIASLA